MENESRFNPKNLHHQPEKEKSKPRESNEEFVINPETEMLVSEGHEYANIPRMRELIRKANRVRNSLPPVAEDHIRLWRGNRPDEIGQNPSFTNSLEGIALPFLRQYQGKISYIDVLKADLKKYEAGGGVPGAEFILPSELAKKAIIVEEKDSA